MALDSTLYLKWKIVAVLIPKLCKAIKFVMLSTWLDFIPPENTLFYFSSEGKIEG